MTRDWRPAGGPYSWPPQPPHELVLPSVTTILGAGVPKPFLKAWGEKMVATYAVEHVDRWNGLPAQDAIDLLRRAPFRFIRSAQERGSAVHAAIEAHVAGEKPGPLKGDEGGYFAGALAYLSEQRVTVLRSEACVFSRAFGYAGTFDLLQQRGGVPTAAISLPPFGDALTPEAAETIRRSFKENYDAQRPMVLPQGATITALPVPVEIADFKTSKAVYPEVALQLAAYGRADFIGLDDGTEEALPAITRGVIVQLKPDGSYKAVPVELGDDVFDTFLAAKGMHAWASGVSRRVLGKPLERAA